MSAPQSQQPHTSNHIRLPDVKLPLFNGNSENWLNFHDLFLSLVHSSTDLSSIQKFYYLRSSLTGEALKLIQTIPISGTNYSVAWNLLVEHFQNPKVLKRNYVQALFEFPVLRRESAADLHSLIEKFEANVRVLKQLGEHTEYWDILLNHFLASRLDPVTRRDWEEYSSSHETTTFKDMIGFVQRRVNVLQQVSTKPVDIQQQAQVRKPNPTRLGNHGAFQQTKRRKCIVCSDDHYIYQCATFARLSAEDKEKLIRKHQLCRNCFRKGHFCRDCTSENTCKKCGFKHHTILCSGTIPLTSGKTIQDGRNIARASTSNAEDPHLFTTQASSSSNDATVAHSGVTSCNTQSAGRAKVILATAVIIIIDDSGREHVVRALLDSGSECCFATSRLFRMLKVKRSRVDVPIAGIGRQG